MLRSDYITANEIELARHALGLTNGRKISYRNRFVCGPGHEDYAAWMAMTTAGRLDDPRSVKLACRTESATHN